ncbi:MAG: GNAT family N-acetyltransferase [Bacteroidetes bacterium]|jgi:predicted GNAT family N-acyltransferase|nr:GNAT family N-acetyltransferase [Bacteroidota bacterium]MBT6687213.1 GNAT family N-acetyltransferase [Bacteroidota bacterium]MBT7144578.1 GNAT family N-acetyltransferase [Bacteroidota bacterium]MBT7490778.1 GNAT family N-acetyltransferase [Bacteroidota bacterium]
MIEIIKFRFENEKLFAAATNIRSIVFVVEQKVEKKLEFDGLDNISAQYLAFFDDKPVGTARWRETEKGIKLERFAVLKSHRNLKIGQHILDKILEDTKTLGKTIYLHAQIAAFNFYKKNGFVEYGEKFVEADIEHYKMRYLIV